MSLQFLASRKVWSIFRREKTRIDRGPTKSGSLASGVMSGRSGFLICTVEGGSPPICLARRFPDSSSKSLLKRATGTRSSVRYQVCC